MRTAGSTAARPQVSRPKPDARCTSISSTLWPEAVAHRASTGLARPPASGCVGEWERRHDVDALRHHRNCDSRTLTSGATQLQGEIGAENLRALGHACVCACVRHAPYCTCSWGVYRAARSIAVAQNRRVPVIVAELALTRARDEREAGRPKRAAPFGEHGTRRQPAVGAIGHAWPAHGGSRARSGAWLQPRISPISRTAHRRHRVEQWFRTPSSAPGVVAWSFSRNPSRHSDRP